MSETNKEIVQNLHSCAVAFHEAQVKYGFNGKSAQYQIGFDRAFHAGWKAAKQDVSEWIKTSDRLPTYRDSNDVGSIFVFFRGLVQEVHWEYFSKLIDDEYTHWMARPKLSLPKPPMEQS